MKRIPSPTGQRQSAFTLAELLVVITIMAVLAMVLFPAIGAMRSGGKKTQCLSNLRAVAMVVLQFSSEHNGKMLPAISGANGWMSDTAWYELLDEVGLFPSNPYNPANTGRDLWGGKWNSIMSCPERKTPARPYYTAGRHELHYAMNQHPGFLNRVNTVDGRWPRLASIQQPGRTMMLVESEYFLTDHVGENLVYPHQEGVNMVFFDGHAKFFEGRLPALPGAGYSQIDYAGVSPADSYPWY